MMNLAPTLRLIGDADHDLDRLVLNRMELRQRRYRKPHARRQQGHIRPNQRQMRDLARHLGLRCQDLKPVWY